MEIRSSDKGGERYGIVQQYPMERRHLELSKCNYIQMFLFFVTYPCCMYIYPYYSCGMWTWQWTLVMWTYVNRDGPIQTWRDHILMFSNAMAVQIIPSTHYVRSMCILRALVCIHSHNLIQWYGQLHTVVLYHVKRNTRHPILQSRPHTGTDNHPLQKNTTASSGRKTIKSS